jgi:hypothetical protein
MEIETDDGQRLSGEGVEKELLEDWDLDLEEHRRKADLESRSSRPSPKLAYKLKFSMPAGEALGQGACGRTLLGRSWAQASLCDGAAYR